jgi:hypothetical protein
MLRPIAWLARLAFAFPALLSAALSSAIDPSSLFPAYPIVFWW